MSICTARTKKGLRCTVNAAPSGFCHVHDPALQCGAPTSSGQLCTVATGGRGRCRKHAEPATPARRVLVDPRASAAARSLASSLGFLHFAGASSAHVTDTLSAAVSRWGQQEGFQVKREVPAPAEARPDRHGYLDLVCFDGPRPALAVEIDRGNKQWSHEKLAAVAARGVAAVWLRWGSKTLSDHLANGVDLIHMPMHRARARAGKAIGVSWHSDP